MFTGNINFIFLYLHISFCQSSTLRPPPRYLPIFISIDGEERLCQFLTIPHLSRGILLSTSFIFWNPAFQINCNAAASFVQDAVASPAIPYQMNRKQQRVFGGGGMSSRKSVARSDCSWQGRNSTSIHWSDPTYSLMHHFANAYSQHVQWYTATALVLSQPFKNGKGSPGTDTMLQTDFTCDTTKSVLKLQMGDRRLKST